MYEFINQGWRLHVRSRGGVAWIAPVRVTDRRKSKNNKKKPGADRNKDAYILKSTRLTLA